MLSRHPFLGTLSGSGVAPRIGLIQGHPQRNRPTPTLAAGEGRSMDLQGGGTCVANVPRLVGYRQPPRAATPYRSTTAAQAKPAKNPLIADQKRDGKLAPERVLLLDHILQTKLAIWGQPLLHKLQGELLRSERRPAAMLPTAPNAAVRPVAYEAMVDPIWPAL